MQLCTFLEIVVLSQVSRNDYATTFSFSFSIIINVTFSLSLSLSLSRSTSISSDFNIGWGAICVLIYDKDQNIVKCHTEALPWFPLGNVKAEYLAFCEAIELAAEFDWIEKLIVIGDSETVYKHWNGHLPLYYSSNNHSMKPMYERAMRSVKHFSSFHYHRCSREENETAKTLSKQTIPGPQSNSSSTRASPLSLPLSTSAAAASEIDPLNDEFDFDDYGDSFVGDSFGQECLDEEFEQQPPVFMASTRTRRRQSSSSSEDSFNIDLKFDAFQISDISHIAGLDDDWLDEDFPQL
jgi:ribonuclease HI